MATRLFLDGKNPYTSSMGAAARLLHPAADFWTYQVDGAHTLKVSYPAGSFLLQAPFMGLGLNHMVSDWVDLGAWLVTAVLIFVMVPPVLRWLAPLLLMTGTFLGAVLQRRHRRPVRAVPGDRRVAVGPVPRPGRGVAARLGGPGQPGHRLLDQADPVVLRAVPHGRAWPARPDGPAGGPVLVALRYGAITAVTFLVVNVPFIVWNPAAWLRGIFLPMIDPLVADGQGIVALALHGLTGGVVLPWMSAAAALALVAMVLAFCWWEPRLRRAWLFLVPLVLFVPARSLANYLSDFVPAALVAALSVAALHRSGAAASATGPSAASAERRWPRGCRSGCRPWPPSPWWSWPSRRHRWGCRWTGWRWPGWRPWTGGQKFRHVEVTVHNRSGARPVAPFHGVLGRRAPERLLAVHRRPGRRPGAGRGVDGVRHPAPEFGSRPRPTASGGWWPRTRRRPNALSTSPLQYWRLGNAAP